MMFREKSERGGVRNAMTFVTVALMLGLALSTFAADRAFVPRSDDVPAALAYRAKGLSASQPLIFGRSFPPEANAKPSKDQDGGPVVVHGAGKKMLPRGAFKADLPEFVQRTVTERGALEPPLAFDADGAMFYPSWVWADYGHVDQRNILFTSDDDGVTWQENNPQIGGVEFNTRGGDPYLYRDEVTGRLFYVLYAGGEIDLAWTDDGGQTWGYSRVTEPGGITDYPKLWTSRPTSGSTTPAGASFYVHLCYNALYRLSCQRSIDGGLTFTPSPNPYPESFQRYQQDTCWSFHTGWGISSPEDGTIYMGKPFCGKLEMAVSHDNGMTWQRHVVASDMPPEGLEDVRVAMDNNGNLYYLWFEATGDSYEGSTPWLSISRDGGQTWSESIDVGVPGLTAAKFPSIVAGDEGRIALFYVGSKVPGGFAASEEQMKDARWDAYVAFSLDALSEDPVFATATVNPADDPLRRGDCRGRCYVEGAPCTYGCGIGSPEIGMYDYLQLALDPQSGRVAASLVDLCVGPCGSRQGSSEDEPSFIAAVGIQMKGPSLLGGRHPRGR